MRFAGPEVPPAGCDLSVDGKGVGSVTSAAWSPLLGQAVALGYVRREYATPGTRLASVHGDVEVVAAT
jgi:glycine cleavage system aminomethyltransferase T